MPNTINIFPAQRSIPTRRGFLSPAGRKSGAVTAMILIAVLFQSACLFRGNKKAVMPAKPVRIAFLPFNTAEGKPDLQWTSMAMPIMMAKIAENSRGLEIVPLWETMQFTLESVQKSRTVTDKDAAYVANWLNAKWASIGELTPHDDGRLTLLVDFIPPQSADIPFRYLKKIKMEAMDGNIRKAFKQFLYYISVPPPDSAAGKPASLPSLRQLAEALDREYGWSVPAEPGKAEEIVANLAQSDIVLARYLFNPSVYTLLKDR